MSIKNILKTFKLNESSISMALGAVVIVVVGVLLVNYFKGIDTGDTFPEGATIETSEPGTTVVTEDGVTLYKVKEGDTLWSISEDQYGTGYMWSDIATANEIADSSLIEEGQALTIPNVTESEVMVTSEEVVFEETSEPVVMQEGEKVVKSDDIVSETIVGGTYTVVHGDTLWSIAVRKYNDGYRWVDLAEENELLNPNLIHAGNVLRLP